MIARNSRGGIKKTGKNQQARDLANKLAGVASVAKSLGIDTSEADAMVAQTKRQGAKSFSGSKEEKAYNKTVNTTGVTANPKNTQATEPGVISSKQGEEIFNDYNTDVTKMEGGGLGTKDSPFNDAQIIALEKSGIREGDFMQGKGVLKPGGYFEQPVSTGAQNTTPDSSATYIDPTTGATTTTTGAGAGSTEEQAKMKEKGYSLSESTTPAEDTTNPEIKKLQEESAMLERDALSFKNKLMGAIITDSELKSDIRAITNAYDARIAEMQDINARQIQGVKTLGLRSGAQYTGGFGGVWGSIISEAERSGLMRITDIESERQSKIIAAKSAAQENNYKIYASLMEDARSLAKEKKTEVANLIQEQKKQDALIAEHKKQIITDAVISEAYAQGYTTPQDIVGAMNAKGNYITLEEADKALKILNPPDALKGLDADYQTFAYLQKIGDPSVKGMGWTEYQRMMANLKQKSITPIDSTKELEKLSKDVQSGLGELMNGATWASVWNRLYTQYRTGDPEQDSSLGKYLDLTLDKSTWATEGAYQTFSAKSQ